MRATLKPSAPKIVIGGRTIRVCLAFMLFWAWEATLVYAPSLHGPGTHVALFWNISNYCWLVSCALIIAFWRHAQRLVCRPCFNVIVIALLEIGTVVITSPILLGAGLQESRPLLNIVGGMCSGFGIILMDKPDAPTKPSMIAGTLTHALDAACDGLTEKYRLTSREADALRLMVRGRKLQGIADGLGVSTNTAKSHMRHVYQKLNVHSSEELFDLLETDNGQDD